MKIRIELDAEIAEEEVIIRCAGLNEEIQRIQKAIAEAAHQEQKFVFYKEDTEYYFALQEILFFETGEKYICAHTKDQVYQVRYRLYELEQFLPSCFMRVSKSTILNTAKIYSISRNISAASIVQFQNTHKTVYVSRNYFKPLRSRLMQRYQTTGAERS